MDAHPATRRRPGRALAHAAAAAWALASAGSAQEALERLGPRGAAAIPDYLRLVEDPTTPVDVAAGAARAFERFDYESCRHAVPALLGTMSRGDPRVTDAAMRALRLWNDRVIDDVRALWVRGNRRARGLAGALLGSIGPVGDRHRSTALALRLATSDVPFARHYALIQRSFAGRAADLPHLTAALDDPDDSIGQTALAYLARLGETAAPALPALGRELLGGRRMTSWGAGEVIARCGAAGLPLLERALESDDLHARWSAITHLHLAGPDGKRLAELVLPALDTNKLQWIEAAARAIAVWSWDSADPLRARARAAVVRAADGWPKPMFPCTDAIAALGRADGEDVPAFLFRWADDSNPAMVEAALTAILALGEREAVVRRLPELLEHADARFAAAAMNVAARLDPPETSLNETLLGFAPRSTGGTARARVRAIAHAAPTFDAAQVARAVDLAIENLGWNREDVDPLFATLGPRALPRLVELLADGRRAGWIERALAVIAADHHEAVWDLASDASIGTVEARGVLLRGLAGAGPAAEPHLRGLDELWHGANGRIANAAGFALARVGPAAIRYVAAALDGGTAMRFRALAALRLLGPDAADLVPAVEAVLDAAPDTPPDPALGIDLATRMARTASIALADLGPRGVFALELRHERGEVHTEALAAALGLPHEPTSIAAARAIARLHVSSPEILQRLLEIVGREPLQVKRWGAIALRELAPADDVAQRAYCRMLGDAHPTLRLRSLQTLTRLPAREPFVLGYVVEALDDTDANVRRAAAALLVKFGPAARVAQTAIDEACARDDERLRALLAPLR